MSFDFDFELAKKAAQELPPSQKQPKTRKMPLLQRLGFATNSSSSVSQHSEHA